MIKCPDSPQKQDKSLKIKGWPEWLDGDEKSNTNKSLMT